MLSGLRATLQPPQHLADRRKRARLPLEAGTGSSLRWVKSKGGGPSIRRKKPGTPRRSCRRPLPFVNDARPLPVVNEERKVNGSQGPLANYYGQYQYRINT